MDALVNTVNELISGFRGIVPSPVGRGTWQQALKNIQSNKYQKTITEVQALVKKYGAKSEEYKKRKINLPAITFGGQIKERRNNANIFSPTGFIIPDIDSIPQQVESLFNLLIQDTNIWFVFRSPSGEGLKVGVRGQNIVDDKDHKKFYFAVEQYFKELYGVKIDTACKDISRLTFVSYDPKLWINPKPQYFDIQKWTVALPPMPEQPIWAPNEKAAGKEKYARKALEGCCQELLTCPQGNKHITRLKKSRLMGGFLQWISKEDILSAFEQAIAASGTPNISQAMKTVRDGLEYGKLAPIQIEDLNKSTRSNQQDIEYYYEDDEFEGEIDPRKVNVSGQNHDDIDDIDDKCYNMTTMATPRRHHDDRHDDNQQGMTTSYDKYENTIDIYKLTSPSGKAYIGQSKHGGTTRIKEHPWKKNSLIGIAIKKYGVDSFKLETLYTVSANEAGAFEKRAIREHNALAPAGYNVSEGSERNTSAINLSSAIQEWLINSKGSFTIEQLDREFCLTKRSEKQNRSKILQRLTTCARVRDKDQKKELIIKKDPFKKNLYHVSSTEMDWIDITAPTEDNFPLKLPFDLDQKISIPPKSIIIVAGSFNSGKTAIILNTLQLNLNSSFEKLFLVSEGAGEIKGRIKSFDDSLSLWKDNVMIASQCDAFDTAIENYNTKGFTCVDYLEPPEGQYYLLTNQIRNIYDALDTGVAMIALQKRSDSVLGRGGEGTAEKARLYMTVDYLCTGKRSIICSLALAKVKQSLDESMQGKELHFRIERGSILTPLTDWMLSSRVNREKCAREYENEEAEKSFKKVEDGDYIFRTENGKNKIKMVRITRKQAEKWAENMPNVNVFKRLERMVADSMNKLFLDKSYFYQIPTILNKANEEASQFTLGESG